MAVYSATLRREACCDMVFLIFLFQNDCRHPVVPSVLNLPRDRVTDCSAFAGNCLRYWADLIERHHQVCVPSDRSSFCSHRENRLTDRLILCVAAGSFS